MKKFEILRYLKQFSLIILLLAVVGAYGIYVYGKNNQTYVATATIKYANSGASQGLTPNGKKIQVEEIYCSTVIDDALSSLGLRDSLDYIRSRFSVKEIIPDEQQEINEALIKKGQDPGYIPTEYKITFTASGTKSADYARDVMDAVLNSYFSFYSEKYIEQSVLASTVINADGMDYDYLEMAQILEESTSEMLTYLENKIEMYPSFRSSRTGFTFTDLYDLLSHMFNYRLPSIYASILSSSSSQDTELICDKLNLEIDQYTLSITNLETQITYLKSLIDNYSESNKEIIEYHYQNGKTSYSGSDYVLKLVEENKSGANVQTEYDSLLEEYVQLRLQCEYNRIKLEHSRYLYSTFNAGSSGAGSSVAPSELIASYISDVNYYYELVKTTAAEVNEYLSASYVKTVSTIKVSTTINIKLYVVLAVAFFTIVGVLIAIVLGRSIDFIDFLLYTDRNIDIPNRTRCDRHIDELSEKLLPDDFTFMEIHMKSLSTLTSKYGRQVGDTALRDFASILRIFGDNYGFVGYIGGGTFYAFFGSCSYHKQELIEKAILKNVQDYNLQHPGYEIEFDCASGNTTNDHEYDIRTLMRKTFAKARGAV